MSTTLRVLAFGVVSGLIWSVVPGTLAELFRSPRETAMVVVSGLLTGVLTSFGLSAPLARFGLRATIVFGALSLPLGAFIFGVLLSLAHWVVRAFSGTTHQLSAHAFAPMTAGAEYAILSVVSIYAIVLFPLAVSTTFLLRRVIHSGHNLEPAA